MIKTIEINIDLTVHDIAKAIWGLCDEEQADLLSELMSIASYSKVVTQIQAVADNLDENGKQFIQEFAERINKDLLKELTIIKF